MDMEHNIQDDDANNARNRIQIANIQNANNPNNMINEDMIEKKVIMKFGGIEIEELKFHYALDSMVDFNLSLFNIGVKIGFGFVPFAGPVLAGLYDIGVKYFKENYLSDLKDKVHHMFDRFKKEDEVEYAIIEDKKEEEEDEDTLIRQEMRDAIIEHMKYEHIENMHINYDEMHHKELFAS